MRATPTTTFASQPAAWRGALSGTGNLDIQLDITVQGPMDKATLEQHCEQLPDVPDATYAARVRIEVPGGERGAGGGSVVNAPVLKPGYLDRLTRPGPRLPGLSSWLLHEVWE